MKGGTRGLQSSAHRFDQKGKRALQPHPNLPQQTGEGTRRSNDATDTRQDGSHRIRERSAWSGVAASARAQGRFAKRPCGNRYTSCAPQLNQLPPVGYAVEMGAERLQGDVAAVYGHGVAGDEGGGV